MQFRGGSIPGTIGSGPALLRSSGARVAAGAVLVTVAILAISMGGCSPDSDKGANSSSSGDSQLARIDRLRSLPYAGFSEEKSDHGADGVVFQDSQRAVNGYTLYINRALCSAHLIDQDGGVVRSWSHPGRRWGNCELLTNGDLLVVGADYPDLPGGRGFTDKSRCALRLSWDNNVIWKRNIPAHHDIEVTPSGRLLTLTVSYRRVPAIDPSVDIRDDRITLLGTDGIPLEHRSLYDAFSARPDLFSFQPVKPRRQWNRDMVDLFHSNAIEWMHYEHLQNKDPLYALGNILVCIRHQDTIAVVDWEKQEIVWAWGQGEVSGPHDATVLENGHILLFDNGLGRDWSRVVELDPLTRQIVWEYAAPEPTDFYTRSGGANQRLANGNTLVTDSDNGEIYEVTGTGEIVWHFVNPARDKRGHRAAIARAKRYSAAYVEKIHRSTDSAAQSGAAATSR